MKKNIVKSSESGVWINMKIKDINLMKSNLETIKEQFDAICERNNFVIYKTKILKQNSRVVISIKVDIKNAIKIALYFEKIFVNKKIDIQSYSVQKWEIYAEKS